MITFSTIKLKDKLFKVDSEKKRLLENFISLSVLQGANYILPLITLPYLVRVLGPEKFGLVMFAQAFIQYFVILTDYGFNLSATREIAIHRDNKEKVSEIFSSVMVIKFGLLILSFIIMSIIVFSFEKFRKDWLIYYLTFGVIIGQVLFPIWFFQGMERMKYITILNIIAKLIFTVCIFIFIRETSDYIYVPLLNSLGFLVAGLISVWVVFKDFGIIFTLPSLADIKHQLKDGWYVFVSSVSINFYKQNCVLILGLFSSNTVVGYFSIAKKLVDVLNQIAGVISQTIYPYVIKKAQISNIHNFLKKVGLLIFSYTFLIGMFLLVFTKTIVLLISGRIYYESVISLKLMAFVPLIIGINVPAVQILLSKGLDKTFSKVLLSGAVLDLILNFVLVPKFSYMGSSIAVIITEAYVTFALYYAIGFDNFKKFMRA